MLGGDGRYYNRVAVQTILRMAAAHGFGRVLVGARRPPPRRRRRAARSASTPRTAGIILSASHNPGGPEGDFGIKYNVRNGGPAPEAVTDALYASTHAVALDAAVPHQRDAARGRHRPPVGLHRIEGMTVEVVDPVADYAALMRECFDFEAIRRLFAGGLRIRVDAMSAIGGPYAKTNLEDELGAPAGSVVNATPLEDFGGLHPDPNPTGNAEDLVAHMARADAPDFGAATDGDADRNMIVGRNFAVTPSDSLALLAAHARLVLLLRRHRRRRAPDADRPPLPTASRARSASPATTPTGWKFFGNSTPASASRCAARRATAPAPTTCARRTGCGPCCSGSTSSPRPAARSNPSCARTGRATAATSIRATTTKPSTPPPRPA